MLQQVSRLRNLIDQTEQIKFVIQPLRNLLRRALAVTERGAQAHGELIGIQYPDRQIPRAPAPGFRQRR
ncbi:hypothetical protein D3C73_1537830 [compost metagenome]